MNEVIYELPRRDGVADAEPPGGSQRAQRAPCARRCGRPTGALPPTPTRASRCCAAPGRRSAPAPTSRRWRRRASRSRRPTGCPQLGRNIAIDKPVIAAVHGQRARRRLPARPGGRPLHRRARRALRHHRGALGTRRAVGRAAAVADPAARRARAADRRRSRSRPRAPTSSASSTACARRTSSRRSPARWRPRSPRTRRSRSPPAKRMVWETAGMPLAAAFERAEELFAPAYLSEDAQEGPRAFREGRAPRWSGA